MKRVTIKDVAEHAGVSKSTVSQYLNKRYEYMSQNTKSKIKKSIKELGYSPNIIARSLTQKSTMTIGVIVANILHVFSTQVIRAIEDYCHELNFHTIVCNADDNPAKEKKYIDMLRDKQVDGIIAFPTGGNFDLYKKLVKENYPIVFMDRLMPGIDVNTVLLDNKKAAKIGVEEFIRKGYERIAMISPSIERSITPRIERIEGYKNTLKEHGIPFNHGYLASIETREVQASLNKMLNMVHPPQALLALNDFMLFEVLKYIKKSQMKVPKDLAIIGIDDVSFASIYNPSITTIAQPTFEMGRKAAELLLNEIRNKTNCLKAEIYRFEPNLIKRSSS